MNKKIKFLLVGVFAAVTVIGAVCQYGPCTFPDNHGAAIAMGPLGDWYLKDSSMGDIAAGINP